MTSSSLQRYASHAGSFTSRCLTYQNDASNAFRGIAQGLASDMAIGEMPFAIPTSCFDWAVLWRTSGHLTRRPGFPSWSWLGWQGMIHTPPLNHDDYDQMWLLKGTWIDWLVIGDDGTCRPLWDSTLEGNLVAPNEDIARARGWIGPRAQEERELYPNEEVTQGCGQGGKREQECEEDNDDSDGAEPEQQQTFCPSYGHSKPGNPFGRLTDWSLLSPLSPPSGPPLPSHGRFTTNSGKLYLRAPTITLKIGEQRKMRFGAISHPLYNQPGYICGFVFSTGKNASAFQLADVNLLLILVTSFGDLSQHHAAGLTAEVYSASDQQGLDDVLAEYLETLPYHINYDFLNVMYVAEVLQSVEIVVGDEKKELKISERVGLGFVLRKALVGVEDIPWTEVVLA